MASADGRPGDRHAHPPVAYRPPVDVRPLLDARMQETGLGSSAIITAALREYLSTPATVPELETADSPA